MMPRAGAFAAALAPASVGCWKVQRGNLVNAGEDTGESTTRRAHSGKFAEMRVYVLQVKHQVLSNLYCPQVICLCVQKLVGLDVVD